ncbi:hypothetical protein [Nocardioides jishulii]|uniref:Uncharacterized protein n=1 Tax=Nocardioides jishulii TaxID=2575440 RepID=A0A4U2YMQ6_9ACTN|nr:hypothetical protein [Nocardioides jishulii]QCX27721.1 hypothetical protein FCL41_09425 [Nocardioides jishulii]TKI62527.1 hypothetical protein FC770_09090 [Nocardioides jishulii]
MSHLTGRQIMLLLGCALAVITLAVGVYGLLRGPGGQAPDTPAPTPTYAGASADQSEATSPVTAPEELSLPHTTDPITYARAVAVALFDWDTSTGFLPTDYTASVLADADPSGQETPGLLTDVATYLPSVDQWLALGAMEVEQRIDIDAADVPDSWAAAVAQSNGQLRPGTMAVTITGTRHRSGVWNGEPAEVVHPISFTVFVGCPPSFERCHVLRLSQLNMPLR